MGWDTCINLLVFHFGTTQSHCWVHHWISAFILGNSVKSPRLREWKDYKTLVARELCSVIPKMICMRLFVTVTLPALGTQWIAGVEVTPLWNEYLSSHPQRRELHGRKKHVRFFQGGVQKATKLLCKFTRCMADSTCHKPMHLKLMLHLPSITCCVL